ncbi:MAG: HEAT repeat domain-containing protein [Armatimonadota bacterium]|jgi:tetratricopeptide (TPR) repeat protein
MRAPAVGLTVLLIVIVLPSIAAGVEPGEPPSSHDAPLLVAGEPDLARMQPIDVIAGHTWALPAVLDGLTDESADVRARCCFLLGQIASDRAVEALQGALNDDDRSVRLFAGIALARMGEEAGYHAARAAYEGSRWWIRFWAIDALARLDAVPEIALDDPDPLVSEIARAGSDGSWEPAVAPEEYTGPANATLDDAIFTFTNYLIGETDWWWHAGRYEQIIRGNETIVWLDPTWLEGLTSGAYLYWSLGRDVEALATYRRAVFMHPDEWESHFELGFFYYNAQKRFADAVPEFERARELGCPPVQARMHAHALERAGYPERALGVWRELHAENPDDGVVRQNLQRLETICGSG